MLAHEPTARLRCTCAAAVLAAGTTLTGCAARGSAADAPVLRIVPHVAWEAQPPLGHPADAVRRNLGPGEPLERIGGHYDYAQTSCPGEHLRHYLEDGTFRRMVQARLAGRWRGERGEARGSDS